MKCYASMLLILAVVFLGGCATSSMLEMERIVSAEQALDTKVRECRAEITSRPKYAALLPKLPPIDATQSPPISLLANANKPSKAEAKHLIDYHDDLDSCRRITMEGVAAIHPAYVVVFSENFLRTDELYLKLLQGQLSWGEHARELAAVRQKSQREYLALVKELEAGLRQSHEYEVSQRQAASQALSLWAANQQQIQAQQNIANALNRPRMTSCRYVGITLICNRN